MTQNKHKGKRLLAGLLSFLMVATGLPLGEMDARASSLVPNTSLTDNGDRYPYMETTGSGNNRVSYGSSSSTGFTFQKMGAGLPGRNTNYDPLDTYRNKNVGPVENNFPLVSDDIMQKNSFNIAAVINDSDAARNTPGSKGYETTVRTAYGKDYWATYYGFGDIRPGGDNSLTYLDPYISYDTDGVTPLQASLQGNDTMTFVGTGANRRAKYFGNDFPVRLYNATYNGGVTELQVPGKPAGTKIEVRQEIKPDDDDKNLLVTYTVANTTGDPVKFMIGNESDTYLYNHDEAPILVTQSGQHLHMMANNGGKYQLSDFDVKVKSGYGRVWAGQYPFTPLETIGSLVYHTGFAFAKAEDSLIQGYDSAASFSAFFDLAPGQTKSATFEVSMRVSVYYVDPTYAGQNGASTGYITKPYNTVQDAIDAIGASGTEKAYIYVMYDTEIPATLNWNSAPNLKSLTIQTSLYDKIGSMSVSDAPGYYGTHPEDMPNGPLKKLIRKDNFAGDLIEVPAGKTLTLTNIEINGNKAATDAASTNVTGALVKVEGQLNLKAGTTLKDNKVQGTATASAIDVVSNGKVVANSGTGDISITGNESTNNVSAVSLANAMAITGSTPTEYPFTLSGNVNVTGNTTKDTTSISLIK